MAYSKLCDTNVSPLHGNLTSTSREHTKVPNQTWPHWLQQIQQSNQ
uniref:Uncharacterized protein n=1 Tax=Rhizophora mucronata TaxID=61149 RepID=A0A2P2N173_RHIMU